MISNLIKFDHVGGELSYGEPRAFWWGGPLTDLARLLIRHVKSSNLTKAEEQTLVKYIRKLDQQGSSPTLC